jgi:hypothetical protein
MAIPWRRRAVGLAIDLGVCAGFATVWVAAGHGAGPVGLLMVLGHADAWGLPMGLGWAAVATLAVLPLVPWRWPYLAAALAGLALLLASWFVFVARSQDAGLPMMTSVQFAGALVARLWYLFAGARSSGVRT